MRLGPTELLIILGLILLLFGGRKLPELARGLGQGLKEFKQATKEPALDEGDGEEGDKKEAQAKS